VKAARGKWKPSSPALIAWFGAFVKGLPGIERRKMFGYPATFVNGKLFAGLYQDSVLLKLPVDARAELFKRKGATPFEPRPGRTMGEFVLVSPSWVKQTAKLRPWLEQAHAYVKSLSPKPVATRPRKSHAKRNKP
jgi:TfoX/Sxy family transcriptional regulator of competence genes